MAMGPNISTLASDYICTHVYSLLMDAGYTKKRSCVFVSGSLSMLPTSLIKKYNKVKSFQIGGIQPHSRFDRCCSAFTSDSYSAAAAISSTDIYLHYL